jgi:hypothetical protein
MRAYLHQLRLVRSEAEATSALHFPGQWDGTFLSADGSECEVHEAYVDADALVEHAQHVGEARDNLFRDFAAGHHMTFYEEPSPALAEAMKAIPPGAVKVTQFSIFQGLDADVEVPHEIPA